MKIFEVHQHTITNRKMGVCLKISSSVECNSIFICSYIYYSIDKNSTFKLFIMKLHLLTTGGNKYV